MSNHSNCDQWYERHNISGKQDQNVDRFYKKKSNITFPFWIQQIIFGGKQNEIKVQQACLKHIEQHDHYDDIEATPTRFVVHPSKHWLRASPDAWINDPSITNCCYIFIIVLSSNTADKCPGKNYKLQN